MPSSKTFLFAGFAISLASVVINTFVLSSVNSRLKAADSEYFKVEQALGGQLSLLNEADIKFDVYRVMHHVALGSPMATAQEARQDAKEILQGFLVRFYAAANDIPLVQVTRIAADEAGEALPKVKKVMDLMQSLQRSKDPAESARLAMEIEKAGKEISPPKTEMAKKLREIGNYADAETAASDGLDLTARLMPVMMSLRDQIVTSIERKESRMNQLQIERSSLARKAAYATYAAISLQIFGLMLIFTRDIARELTKET
jgi:hypothetical protein